MANYRFKTAEIEAMNFKNITVTLHKTNSHVSM